MPDDEDLLRQSEAESRALQAHVGQAAALPGPSEVTARALANALVAVVQDYLKGTSGTEDVELFFEVHGRAPQDVHAWPGAILADLHRHDIPAPARRTICDQAAARAIGYIAARSPLAWQEPGQGSPGR